MALGGGTWIAQNKLLPGAYINVISAKRAGAATSDRGVSAIAYEGDWGVSNQVLEVTSENFERDALIRFGYRANDPKLKNLRELFSHSSKAFLYRLDKNGAKATCKYADAKYTGTRGNKLTIKIANNVDLLGKFDVSTFLDGVRVDVQTVTNAQELKNNDYVDFKLGSMLQAEAGVPLTGGTNGTTITGTEHQAFLKAIEPYYYNSLGCISDDITTKKLYVAFAKRMRDEVGVKFQVVLHDYAEADSECVISVKNNTTPELVYWTTGANAGCRVEDSLTNMKYDGETEVDTNLTQAELESCLRKGELVFHRVGQEVRILEDINTLLTLTDTKNEEFKNNDTIRLVDALAEETANTFNTKYNGKVPNNDDGRIAFWNDHYTTLKNYYTKQVIEKPVAEDVVIAKGKDAKSVYLETQITKTHKMSKLYATIKVQ